MQLYRHVLPAGCVPHEPPHVELPAERREAECDADERHFARCERHRELPGRLGTLDGGQRREWHVLRYEPIGDEPIAEDAKLQALCGVS
ncbi:MAG: hypothetical protein ACRERU_23445 [Methylococcales bacterium]